MPSPKSDIIAQLQRDLLSYHGFKPRVNDIDPDDWLGPLRHDFPNNIFPRAALHEFLAPSHTTLAACAGFVAGLMAPVMQQKGVSMWISTRQMLFPPALMAYGIEPHRVIFLDLKKEKDILWATEEALKSRALSAVITELRDIDFMASRRLQLAAEQGGISSFVFRTTPRHIHSTACVSRWRITSLPGKKDDELPGVGFPAWNVELLKMRQGKPGTWKIAWKNRGFHAIAEEGAIVRQLHKKAG